METLLYLIPIFIFSMVVQFIWDLLLTLFNRFKITLETDGKTNVICLKGIGILPINEKNNPQATFEVTVWDITNGKTSPVLCFAPDFQVDNMYNSKHTIGIPYGKTLIEDWTPLGFVIPDVCVFPKSKTRKLKVNLRILNNEQQTVGTYSSTMTFYNDQKGYEEIVENKIKFFKIKIQTLMSIAMADGKFESTEGHFLTEISENFLKSYEDEQKQSLKKEINTLMKQSYTSACSKEINLYSLLLFLKEEGTQGDKYDLIKSCVDIMSIDGEINEKELKIIDEISNYLDFDYKKVRELIDIHILKGSNLKFLNPESALGIKSSWDHIEIQSHLRKKFVKWNSRMQNCSDEKERNHIQNMLDLISEMKVKYEKKAG